METITLSDGRVVRIPPGMSPEERARFIRRVTGSSSPPPDQEESSGFPTRGFPTRGFSPQEESSGFPTQGFPTRGFPTRQESSGFPTRGFPTRGDDAARTGRDRTGIASLGIEDPVPEKEGTLLGSAFEAVKAFPRGAKQFALMAEQGLLGLATPDKDTDREKKLRKKLQDLYDEIDPVYRDANLPQLAMGLGQVAAMAGTAFIPYVGPYAAYGGAMLMGAGQQAGMVADYEERTGRDVGKGTEVAALLGGLGLGWTEMMPVSRLAGRFGPDAIEKGIDMTTGKMFQSAAQQATEEAIQEGGAGFLQSVLAKVLYDEDALENAGTEALKEAIIGGEVGAVADIIASMYVRSAAGIRVRGGKYQARVEAGKSFTHALETGKYTADEVDNMVTGPDFAAIEERYNKGEITEDQYNEEKAHAEEQEKIRQQVLTGNDTDIDKRASEIHAEQKNKIDQLRDDRLKRLSKRKLKTKNQREAAEKKIEEQHESDSAQLADELVNYGREMIRYREALKMVENGTWNGTMPAVLEEQDNAEAQAELDELDLEVLTSDMVNEEIAKVDKKIAEKADPELIEYKKKLETLLVSVQAQERAIESAGQPALGIEHLSSPPTYKLGAVWEHITARFKGPKNRDGVIEEIAAEVDPDGENLKALEEKLDGLEELEERIDENKYEQNLLRTEEMKLELERLALLDYHEGRYVDAKARLDEYRRRYPEKESSKKRAEARQQAQDGELSPEALEQLREEAEQKQAAVSEKMQILKEKEAALLEETKYKKPAGVHLEYEGRGIEYSRTPMTETVSGQEGVNLQKVALELQIENKGVDRAEIEQRLANLENDQESPELIADRIGATPEQAALIAELSGRPRDTDMSIGEVENTVKSLLDAKNASSALDQIINIRSIPETDRKLEDSKSQDKPVRRDRVYAGPWTTVLAEPAFKKVKEIYDNLVKAGKPVDVELIKATLEAKNYDVPKNPTRTKAFQRVMNDAVGNDLSWSNLSDAQKMTVFERVLGSQQQQDKSPIGRENLLRRKELRRLQKQEGAIPKSPHESKQDVDNLVVAGKTIKEWRNIAIKYIKEAGLPNETEIVFEIEQNAELLGKQVEDVTFLGAFEMETDPKTGNVVMENGRPKLKLDKNNKPIYRPAYTNGAVSSLQNYGNQITFNLSQIAREFGKITDANIDDLMKHAVAHEGAHIHILKNMKVWERKALEKFGHTKVPVEVDPDAAAEGLTWREWVRDVQGYQDKTDADLTEETSVHILDALAQGKIPAAKSVGAIGKIKRELRGRFKAMAGAAQDTDILPVIRVFEKIQNRELVDRREREGRLERKAADLQLIDRAKPEDVKELIRAIKTKDRDKIEEVADRIVMSRVDAAEESQKKPTESLLDSLINDFRARADIDGTPKTSLSVLNLAALEDGNVGPAALDAYFRIKDGRALAYRMPVSPRDLRSFRFGHNSSVMSEKEELLLQEFADMGIITAELDPGGKQVIDGMTLQDPDGNTIENGAQLEEAITRTKKEMLRGRLMDKRIFQWLSSKKSYDKEVKRYGTTLGVLAENSAIAAWRFADNALNFIPGIMKYGMISYVKGGFQHVPLTREGRAVKGLNEIFKTIVEIDGPGRKWPWGEIKVGDAQRMVMTYMTMRRVEGIQTAMRSAHNDLIMARRENQADLALDLETRIRELNALYERANPRKKGKKWPEEERNTRRLKDGTLKGSFYDVVVGKVHQSETTDVLDKGYNEVAATIDRVNREAGDGDKPSLAALKFEREYADFNWHLIQFAHDAGLVSESRKDFMQSMPYIPFYVKEDPVDPEGKKHPDALASDGTLVNINNEEYQKREQEKKDAETAYDNHGGEPVRGDPLIDKYLDGSFHEINDNLIFNVTKNVRTILEQSMENIAASRTMRDEVNSGTAIRLAVVPAWKRRRYNALKKRIDDAMGQKQITEESQHPSYSEVQELKAEIDAIEKIRRRQKKIAEAKGWDTSLIVKTKGITESTYKADLAKVRERLPNATREELEDILQDHKKLEANEIKLETNILENGSEQEYLVADAMLAKSAMSVALSPRQMIEDFFGKIPVLGESERLNRGLSRIVVGSSTLLRELVTRSPAFQLKNIIRDSMQASVTFGGGMELIFKTLQNVIDPDIVEKAEKRGLGIGVDWSPDPSRSTATTVKMLSKGEMKWSSPIDITLLAWDALGRMSKQSEVATRMAVYDTVMAQTDGNAAQATLEAMEIINYGRRGSNPLFSIITSMAPFLNGRIQGLDVMARTHLGAYDAPGILSNEKRIRPDSGLHQARRAGVVLGRGLFISSMTLLYYMAMHDEEEYKNAREDMKNDWWLIPLGDGMPGVKIPIPFEVGVLYKTIPEQIARAIVEEEHDFRDVRGEVKRQVQASLSLDLRPQIIRPVWDAMNNRDVFQRDRIVPSWMSESVSAPEQFNPYTSYLSKKLSGGINKIPLVRNADFLTSPMKLEYMLRQYFGTIGAYGLATADRIAAEFHDDNIVGTAADFPIPLIGEIVGLSPLDRRGRESGFNTQTLVNTPMLGDLLFDPARGGGYQEDFYEMLEDVNKIVTTLGQIEKRRRYGPEGKAQEYEEKHEEYLRHKDRLSHMKRFMDEWREDRDDLLERRDLSEKGKRSMLYRMIETRDDHLREMLDIMADIREDRDLIEQVLGERP